MRKAFVRAVLVGCVLAVFAVPSQAQSGATWGVKGGVSFSTLDLDLVLVEVEPVWRTGLTAGAFATFAAGGNLELQAEVLLTQKGTKFDFFGFEEKIDLTYLDIPVLAQYRMQRGGTAFHVGAGPSFSFKLAEKQSEDGEELDIPDEAKRFDFGFAFGGGVTFNRFVVDVRYTLGLLDIADDEVIGVDGVSAKTRAFAITVGYKFR